MTCLPILIFITNIFFGLTLSALLIELKIFILPNKRGKVIKKTNNKNQTPNIKQVLWIGWKP